MKMAKRLAVCRNPLQRLTTTAVSTRQLSISSQNLQHSRDEPVPMISYKKTYTSLVSKQSYSVATETGYSKKKSDLSESRERHNLIRNFYSDPDIDKSAEKPLVRLNPLTMLYMGVSDDNSHILRSANYLRNELPIRLAHMIKELRSLPFIVAVNPSMLEIHERCIKAFRNFENFEKEIRDEETEKRFRTHVGDMLEMNKDLLIMLCDGFRDSRKYIKNESFIKTNLNRTLTARLGIRLLCEHHMLLSKQSNQNEPEAERDENWVGIINKKFFPKKIIENSGRLVARICTEKYGVAPKLKIDGHIKTHFPYMPFPLEYIFPELLKNSFRATCEQHRGAALIPDVTVTIAINDKECIFRIRDRGGGVPLNLVNKIFDYHFSTASADTIGSTNTNGDQSSNGLSSTSAFSDECEANSGIGMLCEASSSRGLAVMHGYGFGLPTSKAYAEYLGGSLAFQSMQGIGSDFYLRLALLDSEPEMVRI